MITFKSDIFPTKDVQIGGTTETIVRGGRDKFGLLKRVYPGKQIGVIGYKSQGPAQAQNLRDTFNDAGADTKVVVGLREGSDTRETARKDGFTEANGTLGDVYSVVNKSDLVLLLINDAAQVEEYRKIFAAMRPGATLGFSHGFLLGHLESIGESFPKNINVIGVCPKGMGPSVRRLYEQGKEKDGAGINCSFTVENDLDGMATDMALGWAIGLGAPSVFRTTLHYEYLSDIFGERMILLGAVRGAVEALFRYFVMMGATPEKAFLYSAENITGPISRMISHHGIKALYESLDETGRNIFRMIYSNAYRPAKYLAREIYDEVESGNEIRSVVMAGKRHAEHPLSKEYPMGRVDGTQMWTVGKKVRANRNKNDKTIVPFTAGLYCAVMMAQVDLLIEKGHCFSEICNESIIEAVDSLNPYMHKAGVDYMVDNCSVTARLGTRKWGPRFDYILTEEAFTKYDIAYKDEELPNAALIKSFENHIIHDALQVCSGYRPSVDIAL